MRIEVRKFESSLPDEAWLQLRDRLLPEQQFLACRWLPSWSATQLPRNRWCGPTHYYVAFGPDGNVLGVLPFAYQRYGPLRLPALAGFYFPFRGLPFACGRELEIAHAMLGALRGARALAFRIGPTSHLHPSAQALTSALHAEGWSVISQKRGTEFAVDLPESIDAFRNNNMSANLRNSIGRKHRRMQRQGDVRIERYTGLEPAAWVPVLEDMAAIESQSWVGKTNGFLHFCDPMNAAFWRACLADPRMSSSTHAAVLYFDGRPCAFEFWFDSGPSRYFVAGLHDERVASHSPGYHLMQLMIEDAIARRLTHISLGQGDAGYKSRFGAKPAGQIEDWILLPPGFVGRTIKTAWDIRQRFVRSRSAPDSHPDPEPLESA